MPRSNRRIPCCVLAPLATVVAIALAIGVRSEAQSGSGAVQNTADAQRIYEPGDVHLDYSRVYVHVGKVGLGHEHGVMGRLKAGRLPLAAGGKGELVFDMPSFQSDSDAARRYVGLAGSTDAGTRRQVDANMLGPDVLDVARFPTASFAVSSATLVSKPGEAGPRRYQLDGEFTLHGVTRPLRLVAEGEDDGSWTHLRGNFAILQTAFGIRPYSKAFGAIGVADPLRIYGDLWIARERLVSKPQ